MFKVFWVGNDDKNSRANHDTLSHDSHHANTHHDHEEVHHESQAIEVDMRDTHDHDTDIGQIAVDILDTPSNIIIVAPVAGVDPAEVDIWLSRNILTISGHRHEAPIYLEAKRLLVEECFYGAFSRSIILPENLGFDKIRATIEHNVIMIEIPKLTLISKSIKIAE
jgi:HSP20 family protein